MPSRALFPELDTPALVVDLDVVDANIAEMADVARRHGVRLRPHTKTHKMPVLAHRQLAAGASGITCSTLSQAEVMAEAGCTDIHIVVPVWGEAKLRRLQALRERARVILSLDSVEVAEGLGRLGLESRSPVEVLVNVDTGDHRVGRPPGRPTADLVRRLVAVPGIDVRGLFTHAGHSYESRSPQERDAFAQREAGDLVETAELCRREGIAIREISPGTTPTVRTVAGMPGVTEVRPGSYIFNDTKMMRLGVATEKTVAVRVLSTVVARPNRERVVVDAGNKSLTANEVGSPGWIVAAGWPELTFEFLAVDVGVARFMPSRESADGPKIGDRLAILPSCSVVEQFDVAYGVRGDKVTEILDIAARGKFT